MRERADERERRGAAVGAGRRGCRRASRRARRGRGRSGSARTRRPARSTSAPVRAAARGADRERERRRARRRRAPPAPSPRRSACLPACARAGRDRRRRPRCADPGARRRSKATPVAPLTLTRRSSRGAPEVDHRDAAARQRRPPRACRRARSPARAPCRAGHAVADGQRPRVEHDEPPPGGGVERLAAGRDRQAHHRERRGRA